MSPVRHDPLRSAALLGIFLVACSGPREALEDGGPPPLAQDGGTRAADGGAQPPGETPDAGSAPDAGPPREDAGLAPRADAGVVAAPDAGTLQGSTFTNPVLARDFADPAIVRAKDGTFYAYATGGLIQRARSRDLVTWEYLGNTLAAKPTWANQKNAFWAPDVSEHGGRYYLYFSAEQNAGTGSFCIGVATADAPDAAFQDVGAPIVCGASFVNIDPMAYDDPVTGKRLLYWGSGFGPIKVQELAADRVRFQPGSAPITLLVTSSYAFERLIEAAWLHKRGEYYYLFYSGDDCCGSATSPPHYAVLVARAKSATGPYEDYAVSTGRADNTILVNTARFLGPGHNSVITDDEGTDWMLYHAFDTTRPGARMLMIDRINYVNGWPSMTNRIPSSTPKPGPVIRR